MDASVTMLLFLSLFQVSSGVYRFHFFVNELLSWQDAQKHCRMNYEDLSTIRSKDLERLSNNPLIKDFFWIGLQRDGKNYNQWIWSTGEAAEITFWDDGEPSSYFDKCGAVKKTTFKTHDGKCDTHMPFYCMLVFELIVIHQESTWEEALLYCQKNYLDLAIINSEDVMEAAEINSTGSDTDDLWIGLRFLAGHWFWVNGEGLGYKAWSSDGELMCPAMNQRCGVYDRNKKVWKPVDCEQRLNFLCISKKHYH